MSATRTTPAPASHERRAVLTSEYTVTHAARTARLAGMKPSALIDAFLRALEDDGRRYPEGVA